MEPSKTRRPPSVRRLRWSGTPNLLPDAIVSGESARVCAGLAPTFVRALAAGVGARRRVALDRLGQLGRLERDAVQDVALADLDLRNPK